MARTRLDLWKSPRIIETGFINGDDAQVQKLLDARITIDKTKEKLTINSMITACKELIYDVVDGSPVFHAIMFSIDANRVEIVLSNLFTILPSSEETEENENEDEEIRNTLAMAVVAEVPVYPNTPELASELAKHHLAMLTHGFAAPDGEGGKMQLQLTRQPGSEIANPDYLSEIDTTTTYFPAEIELIKQSLRDEIRRRDHAGQILAALSLAISDLEKNLQSQKRNEGKLQKCLTDNPILFGLDYVRMIPKHRLGAEYEMDYALEKTSGLYDLVEIEASNHKLYTAAGNPSNQLVHAEQQVLDWLTWIEANNAYARQKLPALMSPVGFVVIGRRDTLSDDSSTKLRKRNTLLKGYVQILTYDDLLDRARTILTHLEGLNAQSANNP